MTGGQTLGGTASMSTFAAGGEGEPGGGILNRGTLTLDHSTLTGNRTGGGGRGFNGVSVVGTSRAGTGGGEGGRGGGIFNALGASLTVTDSSITGNTTGNGGNGGKLVTFKVKVTNTGNTRATGVKVKATGAGSGVTRPIGDIGAGASKTVQVPVRMKQAGKKKITFRVTSANAGSKSAAKKVKVRKPKKKKK